MTQTFHDDTMGTDELIWRNPAGPSVAAVMQMVVPTVRGSERVWYVATAITRGGLGCVGVVDDAGKLMGVITDGDLRRKMGPQLSERPATQVMTWKPLTILASATVDEALAEMNERRITQLFVVDGENRPLGIVHIHQLLAARGA